MRVIVLDTETTGLSHAQGHRVIEIGCIEIIDSNQLGECFHVYIDPEREVPRESVRIHGLTSKFLAGKPKFHEVAKGLIDFIGSDKMIIHNAAFDIGFLNSEMSKIGLPSFDRANVVDTLTLAREKFPGSKASLDALCKRFGISLVERNAHGALIDAKLLARVYLEIIAASQCKMQFDDSTLNTKLIHAKKEVLLARIFLPSEDELLQHTKMLAKIKSPIWSV